MTWSSGDPPHDCHLSVSLSDERRARLVERALAVEVGEIDDARSSATVAREADTVSVHVAAADLVALRAGVNTWTRFLDTAEQMLAVADDA
ncbi:KEOPS complex subunit Pcc1 [Salinirubrum litoreum]|uniref:KEOPS complex subunit Pcc1 n=1 Tax=Salinirubrum litoreum TaxID=1126234 RepID=A0ABD5RFI3_9EURY|nr:KEOPS complex subunit Pcc1 [Salinirubrum litoreum]